MDPLRFDNRHVLVTGAGKGIGRDTALHFARRGAAVTVADIDEAAGAECEALIRSEGGTAGFITCDVADESEVEKLFERAAAERGPVSVLVNNAGFGDHEPIFSRSYEAWHRILAVNLGGAYLCSRAAARQMRDNGGGAVVNIASTRALMSEANTEPYSASKGGIRALTHSLAVSLGPFGIRVNSISPGWIDVSEGRERLREADHAQHPAGRVGRTEDIAWACLYLASDQAGFITGANLVVDGGMTVRMIYEE